VTFSTPTLDYIKFAKELMSSTDEMANDLGKHMAIRLGNFEPTDQTTPPPAA
jgi:hypothetical protein